MGRLGLTAPPPALVLLLATGAAVLPSHAAAGGAAATPATPAAIVAPAEFRVGSLIVKDPWARPTPPAAAVGVVYLSITNVGRGADRLLSVESPRAQHVEMHESRMVQGTMQMRPLDSLECPAGATVRSEPGGLHIMLLGLDAPLVTGREFPLTLNFRDARAVTVKVRVEQRAL